MTIFQEQSLDGYAGHSSALSNSGFDVWLGINTLFAYTPIEHHHRNDLSFYVNWDAINRAEGRQAATG